MPLIVESLNTREAAAFLGTSKSTLEHWRIHGEGPRFICLGKRAIRYRMDDLKQWLAEQPSYSSVEQMRNPPIGQR